MKSTSPSTFPGAPALQHGFMVLNALIEAGSSQGIRQLSDKTGLSKASIYRMLKSLEKIGYIEQHPVSKQYAVCANVFGFIHAMTSHFLPTKRAYEHLREAAGKFQRSVYLSMLAGRRSMVIAASGPLGDTAVLGVSGLAYATASGKILAAQLPKKTWLDFAPLPGEAPATPWTNLDPKKFVRELTQARRQGVAWSVRENCPLCSMAAPVLEPNHTARHAIAFLLTFEEWNETDREKMARELIDLASSLSIVICPRLPSQQPTRP